MYWADFQGAAIKTVPLGGGMVTTLVTGENGPTGVAVDSSYVYWSTVGGDIKRAPLSGGTATTLVSNQVNPAGVAVDLDNVYWANSGDPNGTNGTLNSAPLADGPHTPSTLLGGLGIPVGVVVHDGQLYWATAGVGHISGMPVAGGPVTTVLSGLSTPEALAIGP